MTVATAVSGRTWTGWLPRLLCRSASCTCSSYFTTQDGAAAATTAPEKKKKKEKSEAKLKPKLNFAVQTVQGSYYGSNNNREEVRGGLDIPANSRGLPNLPVQEEGEDKPAPSLPSMRAFVRESSLDSVARSANNSF